MYSLVLMTAMSTTPSAPEFNGYFRDLFFGNCSGCSGYTAPRYSCSGGGSNYPAGCSGSHYNGCNGCNGDTFVNRVRRWFDRGNCCGGSGSGYGVGCSGSMAYSCFGSSQAAYSCFGGPAVSYTPVFNGGQSCYGGPIPSAPPPVFDPYPTTPTLPGSGPPPTIPYAPPEVAPGTNLNTGLKPAGSTGSALVSNGGHPTARATVIVKLPTDARLFADARQLALTGPERKFVTPELPAGQSFTYRFRIEYDRDGETVSVTKRVPVQAGGLVTIEFTDLTAKALPEKDSHKNPTPSAVAATPTAHSSDKPVMKPEPPAMGTPSPSASAPTDHATITVKLPAGAALFVDDRKSPSNEPVRQFRTPPIPTGRDFAYLMRAEIIRNGQTETFTQKVPFRAGERVEVDFTAVGR
jgi:uncharacterized protein (TIGR03000 family)